MTSKLMTRSELSVLIATHPEKISSELNLGELPMAIPISGTPRIAVFAPASVAVPGSIVIGGAEIAVEHIITERKVHAQ